MEFEHVFTVPAPPDAVWAALIDPHRAAPCLPGATLRQVEGAEFAGSLKVKVGPVSLVYRGSGRFVETDETARRMVITASGTAARGSGTAAVIVTIVLRPDGDRTEGVVHTELDVTGKHALAEPTTVGKAEGIVLDDFAGCLARALGEPPTAAAGEEPTPTPAAPAPTTTRSVGSAPRRSPRRAALAPTDASPVAPQPPSFPDQPEPVAAAPDQPEPVAAAPSEPVRELVADPVVAPGPAVPLSARRPRTMYLPPVSEAASEPIDLIQHTRAPMLKRLLPLVGASAAVLLLLIILLRRRHRR